MPKEPEPDPLPWASHGNVVRVSVPHDVYFNLEKIQKVQTAILKRLGCPACCSGHDIRFEMERSFLVDAQLNIRSLSG